MQIFNYHRIFSFVLFICLVAFCFMLPCKAYSACGITACGNGILDPAEGCDDGNTLNGDGCDSGCEQSFDMETASELFTYTGEFPRPMVTVDLNNDGLLEPVIVTNRPAALYAYLMDAQGTLTQTYRYPLDDSVLWVDAGNLNADHFIDIVTVDATTDEMHVFFGNGDGTMTMAKKFIPGDRPWSVEVGDINSDGYEDIIVGNRHSHYFTIYLHDGNGNFMVGDTISTGGDTMASKIFDFNADGYNDLILLSGDETFGTPSLEVHLGSINGLSLSQHIAVSQIQGDAIILDLNKDGHYLRALLT
jgi:cysteine-rich repeat protein